MAELLNKETFNLYGSLKRRNIAVRPGNAWLTEFLIADGCICAGSSSVTLVAANEVREFVKSVIAATEQRRSARKKGKRERVEKIHVPLLLLITLLDINTCDPAITVAHPTDGAEQGNESSLTPGHHPECQCRPDAVTVPESLGLRTSKCVLCVGDQ